MDKDREAIESFVARLQQDVPALKDAKVEYRKVGGKKRKSERVSERKSGTKHYWMQDGKVG